MPIKINKEACIGCGACAALCPENFEMDEEDGKAKVVGDKPSHCAKEAEENCPTEAITVDE